MYRYHTVAALILFSLPSFAVQKQRLRLEWQDLAPVIGDRKIALVLPDGTAIEGKVLGVEAGALQLQVTKTSDRKVMRKGPAEIPRAAVRVIRITRYANYWRLALTPGIPGAALGAMAVATSSVQPTPDPVKVVTIGMAVAVGTTITGYYLGKKLDCREWIEITVVPHE
jgi:hypothetical protein